MLPSQGQVVEPAGDQAVPVYGRAYPESSAYPEGSPTRASYRYAKTYDDSLAGDHTVVRGADTYYQIWFGHRIAYVRAADVRIGPGVS